MEDSDIVALYWARSEQAIAETDRKYGKLCRAIAMNLLGIREARHYPDERFWRIAGEEGNSAILGCDAHCPAHTADTASEHEAFDLAARCGVPILPFAQLRPIK